VIYTRAREMMEGGGREGGSGAGGVCVCVCGWHHIGRRDFFFFPDDGSSILTHWVYPVSI
jgi:hypothetical protein